jgi:hypothetical protein
VGRNRIGHRVREYFLTETARREVPKRAVADEEELYE